jgi:hypothetical protein
MHQRQHDAGEENQDRYRGTLGKKSEGRVADAEAAQYSRTVFPFGGEVGNAHGLERHIH